jgi:hypothetical protein
MKDILPDYQPPRHEGMTDKEELAWLRHELQRVKIQRNDYHMELILARRKMHSMQADIKHYESYINRKK